MAGARDSSPKRAQKSTNGGQAHGEEVEGVYKEEGSSGKEEGAFRKGKSSKEAKEKGDKEIVSGKEHLRRQPRKISLLIIATGGCRFRIGRRYKPR